MNPCLRLAAWTGLPRPHPLLLTSKPNFLKMVEKALHSKDSLKMSLKSQPLLGASHLHLCLTRWKHPPCSLFCSSSDVLVILPDLQHSQNHCPEMVRESFCEEYLPHLELEMLFPMHHVFLRETVAVRTAPRCLPTRDTPFWGRGTRWPSPTLTGWTRGSQGIEGRGFGL